MSDERAAADLPLVKRRLRGKQAAPAYAPLEEDLALPQEEPEVRRRPARRGRSEERGPAVKRRPAARRQPATKRRPAARRSGARERCEGREGEACIFSTQEIGAAARANPGRASGPRCTFCSPDNLQRCLGQARGKGQITTALAFFEERNVNIFSQAQARISALISDEALDACLGRLRRLHKKGATKEQRGQNAKEKRESREADQWDRLLAQRKPQQHFTRKDKSYNRSSARPNELKRLGKKFPAVYSQDGAAKRPGAEWQTPLAASFRQWAEEHSWAMCEQCHRLTPKKFHPKHFRRPGFSRALKHSVKACKHCARGVGYPVPQLADVPDPLRKLPATVLNALAVFDVHTGPWEQEYNAYRAHTAPIRFSWKPLSVEERLAELETEQDWEKGKAAFEWLRSADDSSYKHFLKGHRAFLRQRETLAAGGDVDPGEPVKWLPLRFMETVGLECAIWPHLYWKTDMTETWARSQDVRRQARAKKKQREQAEEPEPAISMGAGFRGDDSDTEDEGAMGVEDPEPQPPAAEKGKQDARDDASDDSDPDGEEDADEPRELKRASAKASFVAKIFSPVAGYGACYELQHFVYDLWLASSLGGARNASGTTLRGALAGRVFSPMYWQTQHAGLVDCVRQIGLPHLFITIAPLEASAPYHAWLEDELAKLLQTRTQLPAAETFHLAHLLMQAAEGLIGGSNKQNQAKASQRWTQHVLSGADGSGRQQLVVELFARLEFQDGKRRRHTGPSQSYHGSGRAHLHMLVWLSDPTLVDWPQVLRADLPSEEAEPELRSLVEGSQLDWENSGWPQREEPTTWEEGVLRLHHPEEAHRQHVRAWMPDVLGALQCHMDVQVGDGRALLLQYAASYTSKFSDQFATSWLNEEASDYHLARKVLVGIPSVGARDVAAARQPRVPPSPCHGRCSPARGQAAGLGERAGRQLLGSGLRGLQVAERRPQPPGLPPLEQQGRPEAEERPQGVRGRRHKLALARRLLRAMARPQRPLPKLQRPVGRPSGAGAGRLSDARAYAFLKRRGFFRAAEVQKDMRLEGHRERSHRQRAWPC